METTHKQVKLIKLTGISTKNANTVPRHAVNMHHCILNIVNISLSPDRNTNKFIIMYKALNFMSSLITVTLPTKGLAIGINVT